MRRVSGQSTNPFAPRGYLETGNSLNRVLVAGTGETAVHLLSADALIARIEGAGLAEVLSERCERPDFPRGLAEIAFGECPGDGGRDSARSIIDGYAEHVAAFLRTLLEGPRESRRARDDWDDRHWDWWAGTRRVVLGGGLSGGYFGHAIAGACGPFFGETGRELVLPARRRLLPLAGAARLVRPASDGVVAAFDFGHTSVKRCAFVLENGRLADYYSLGTLATPRDFDMRDGEWRADRGELRRFFFETLESGALEADGRWGLLAGIAISLANYVQDGRLVPRGLFGFLAREGIEDGNDLGAEIAGFCAERGLGEGAWSLRHDGTAAAACYSESEERTAVILLGSAVGGGFPLDPAGLPIRIEGLVDG